MTSLPPPKALLFDIGGVCVVSPFQGILDYERAHNIPIGYINFAIQRGHPTTGAWQLIERGEVELNDAWFAAFNSQLSNPTSWAEFCKREALKNSKDDGTVPKVAVGEEGKEDVPPVPEIDAKKMFWQMMRMSRTPDTFMYPALKKLQASDRFVLGALSNTVAYPTGIRDDTGELFTKGLVHAPPPNPYANDSTDISDCFEIFISSAHSGVRKPEPVAYELAVRELSRVSEGKGRGKIKPAEVLFIDDIGINLKWAKKSGLRTLKVDLGKTKVAVEELERQTGLKLLDEKPRL
ncbi:HAD-like domain-containing protein [Lophiotrema nucula]|uniref:HAD-like domain-containing protein n=1 Tax=Lophiotrema nucula TaxID=690887 RepID=A0A6A5ZTA7_9PLEO|nr:HAD-like domain-containing protein [Lophiotrema nucula]